jgi:hypothetical protein
MPFPGQMSSLALVVFNRNDREGTLRVLAKVGRLVSEVVVIDSSGPEESERVRKEAEGIVPVSFHRVLPLGCTEPLRPYSEALVTADRIVSVDTDEVPTDGFVRRLSEPIDSDVLFLPRHDVGINLTRWLPRIYRPGRLGYEGWIHEEPRVLGTSSRSALDEGLEHVADYPHYLSERGRGAAYLPIESFERPFTGRQAWTEFHSWSCRLLTLDADRPPPPFAVSRLVRNLRRSAASGAPPYFGEYVLARYRHFVALPPELRRVAVAIRHDLRRCGGVTQYLGLNDPKYVERLSSGYPWEAPPEHPLVALLRHRYRTGSALREWGDLDERSPVSSP